MKRTVIVLLLLTAGSAVHAQDQARGRRVVDDAVAALGGDKFLAMKDRIEAGRAYSFYREELTGLAKAKIYTRYVAQSSKDKLGVEEREAFGKDEDSAVLFQANGDAWELTFRGARPLAQDRVTRYLETTRHNIFYILHNRLKEPGMIFESRGSDVIDNMPVEIVDITDAQNQVTTVYFHRSTKLPIRQMFYRRDPKTRDRDEEVTIFSKYRELNGVQWPYAIQRYRNDEKIFEMYSDTVDMNPGLSESLFTLPSGVKKLKPLS